MKRKTLVRIRFSVFVFLSLFFISFFLNGPTTAKADDLIGKVASDGTRMVVKYWHPFIKVRNATGYPIEGFWFEVPEGYLIEYPDMQVIMAFAGPSYKIFNYTIEYFHIYYNQTAEIYQYTRYETVNRSISAMGNYEGKDEWELPNLQEKIHVVITYENIYWQFDYKLAELIQEQEYSLFQLKFNDLKTFINIFLILVLGGGLVAGGIIKKAGRFDVELLWALIIPLGAGDFFLLWAESAFDGSYKEAFFAFPTWGIYAIFFICSLIVWLWVLNKAIGVHYVDVAVYDTTGMLHDSDRIPTDKSHKYLLEAGFFKALIRLFSRRKQFIRFRKGSFKEITIPKDVIVRASDDIDAIINQMKSVGFIFLGPKNLPDGTIKLSFSKTDLEFEETAVCPQWAWNPTGTSVADQYWCKHKYYEQSRVEVNWWWLPAGILTGANIFFTIFFKGPKEGYGPLLKGILWIIIGIIVLVTAKFNSITGRYDIEVLDMHVAKAIVEAQYVTAKAENDAKVILELKDRIIELENKMEISTLDDAKKIARPYVRELRTRVFWEHKKKPEEESGES